MSCDRDSIADDEIDEEAADDRPCVDTATGRRLVGPALLLAVLSGCGGGEASSDVIGADLPIITLTSESDGWPLASVDGVLAERDGCVFVGDDLAVFPLGTTRDASGVVFADGVRLPLGTQVSLAGGFFEVAAAQDDWAIVPAAEVRDCAGRSGADTFVWARPDD